MIPGAAESATYSDLAIEMNLCSTEVDFAKILQVNGRCVESQRSSGKVQVAQVFEILGAADDENGPSKIDVFEWPEITASVENVGRAWDIKAGHDRGRLEQVADNNNNNSED